MIRKTLLFIAAITLVSLLAPRMSYAELPSGTEFENLDDEIEEFMDEHEDITAGLMFSVFTPDEILSETYEGYQDIDDDIEVTDESVFDWGSITKLLTWVSIMQLVEDDLVDLEADITEYLPEDFLDDFEHDEPVTMVDLMNHQGGFEDDISDLFVNEIPDDYSLEDEIEDNQPDQVNEPGEVTAYSNWGAALAGFIVEEVSEQPFYEYVHENILEPLDMNDTALAPDLSDNPDIQEARQDTTGYFPSTPPAVDDEWYMPLYPAGSTVSTLPDLITFAQALFPSNENSPLFDNDNTLAAMFETTETYGETDAPRNAHGFQVTIFENPAYGHRGNTSSFSTNLLLDIEEEVGYVVMTNEIQETVFTLLLPEVIFGDYAEMDAYENIPAFDITSYQSTYGYINGIYSIES